MDLVQMSVQAGVLIAAVVIVRAITLYRLPKTSFLALWGIVIARLLIPFSLTSKWSIYNLFGGLLKHEDAPAPAEGFAAVWRGQGLVSPEAVTGPAAAMPVISPLTALWIGGVAVLAAVFAVLLVRNYRALRTAVPMEDHAVITKWREEYRLLRPLAVVRSDTVDSPASIGILRPRIVFPQKMDLDNKRLTLCAVCIHWFNSMVWVMLVLLNRDLELSCDEMVLLAIAVALALTLCTAAGFTTGAMAKDNDSTLPDGQTPVSQHSNEEAGPRANESTPSALLSVNRGDEHKFTPEKWAEILKEVEAGGRCGVPGQIG